MRILIFAVITIVFFSCSQNQVNKDNSENNPDSLNSNVDSLSKDVDLVEEISDSILWMGNQKWKVTDASDAILNQGVKMNDWPKEDSLMLFFRNVKRLGDSLIFETAKSGEVVLEDIQFVEDTDFDAAYYSLQGDVGGSDYWELFAMGYEYHWFLLVSKMTGDTTLLNGRPLFSPDGKWMITGNVDLEAAFTPNGFELFKINDDVFKKVGEVDPLNWGPYSMKWISNEAVLVTAGSVDYENGYEISYKNIVLTMLED